MAQALGYVTKADNGGFKGVINMLSPQKRIKIVPSRIKETDCSPTFGSTSKIAWRSGAASAPASPLARITSAEAA